MYDIPLNIRNAKSTNKNKYWKMWIAIQLSVIHWQIALFLTNETVSSLRAWDFCFIFSSAPTIVPRIMLHIKWSLNKYLLPRQMNEWALLNTLGEEQKPPGSPTSQRLWARHPARTLPLLRCLGGSSGQPRSGSRGDQRGRWLNLLLQEWKWKWKIGSRKDYIFR